MAIGNVYASETGGLLVNWSSPAFHSDDREPSQMTGWRECADGTRKLVKFCNGKWVAARKSRARKGRNG